MSDAHLMTVAQSGDQLTEEEAGADLRDTTVTSIVPGGTEKMTS